MARQQGFFNGVSSYFGGSKPSTDPNTTPSPESHAAREAAIRTQEISLDTRETTLNERQVSVNCEQRLLVIRENELTSQVQDHVRAVQTLYERTVDLQDREAALAEGGKECARIREALNFRIEGTITKRRDLWEREKAFEEREKRCGEREAATRKTS